MPHIDRHTVDQIDIHGYIPDLSFTYACPTSEEERFLATKELEQYLQHHPEHCLYREDTADDAFICDLVFYEDERFAKLQCIGFDPVDRLVLTTAPHLGMCSGSVVSPAAEANLVCYQLSLTASVISGLLDPHTRMPPGHIQRNPL